HCALLTTLSARHLQAASSSVQSVIAGRARSHRWDGIARAALFSSPRDAVLLRPGARFDRPAHWGRSTDRPPASAHIDTFPSHIDTLPGPRLWSARGVCEQPLRRGEPADARLSLVFWRRVPSA